MRPTTTVFERQGSRVGEDRAPGADRSLLTAGEVADRFGVSAKTILNWTPHPPLPHEIVWRFAGPQEPEQVEQVEDEHADARAPRIVELFPGTVAT